jgi:L-threonylcarbamoyladenylate synthase
MQRVKLTQDNLKEVLTKTKMVLQKDGLVVFPSDTVYGLAVNATSKSAVGKLLEFKERPANKAVSIAVADLDNAQKFVEISPKEERVLSTLLPGKFTIVLPSKHKVDSRLEAEDKTLGIRLPDYFFTKALSQSVSFPYTATSANLHSKGPHYSIETLFNTLSDKKKNLLDLVIDFGELPHSLPSTVINFSQNNYQTIRPGDFVFQKELNTLSHSEAETKSIAQTFLNSRLSAARTEGLVLILQGDLGVGKTVFAQGIGEALGIKRVVSPTFVTYYEYLTQNQNVSKMHHFDLYRLENKEELNQLGMEKLLSSKNLLIIEWGEKLGAYFSLFQKNAVQVYLVDIEETSPTNRNISIFSLK